MLNKFQNWGFSQQLGLFGILVFGAQCQPVPYVPETEQQSEGKYTQ